MCSCRFTCGYQRKPHTQLELQSVRTSVASAGVLSLQSSPTLIPILRSPLTWSLIKADLSEHGLALKA